MEMITAEQAAEAAKGLTFEKVWAALMESRQRVEEFQIESQKRIDKFHIESEKRIEESRIESQKQMRESRVESQKQMREIYEQTQKEINDSRQRTDKTLAELSKNIGGLGNSLGRLTEVLFSADLWVKFNELGYPFNKQGPHVKFYKDRKVLAEADYLLENGEYAMPVEVKTELTTENVNDLHMTTIELTEIFAE